MAGGVAVPGTGVDEEERDDPEEINGLSVVNVLCGGGVALRMGDGFRLTKSCMASNAHISSDLKAYLFETRAILISWGKLARVEVATINSGGLHHVNNIMKSLSV